MILYESEVVDAVVEELNNYTIKTDSDLQDFLHEVIDGFIDIYYNDIFNSVEFLWSRDYLNDIDGNIVEAIQRAQYEYYRDIVDENIVEIYNKLNLEEAL